MSLHWNVRRAFAPHIIKRFPGSCVGHVLDDFTCSAGDEYRVEGEMMMALPPFAAKFSPDLYHGCMLGVADEDGHLQLLDTRKTGSDAIVKGWSAHSNAVFDIAWVNNDNKLVTASGDQTARLWDIVKSETIGIFRGHTCSLKSVNVQPQSSNVFATGARDGNVMLWDTRCCMKNGFFGPVNTIHGAHRVDIKVGSTNNSRKKRPRRLSMLQQDSRQSVASVVFQDNHHIFTAGACDGLIKMWDIRKTQRLNPVPFHSIPYPGQGLRRHGYTCLVLDSTQSRLFASCTNDVIYMYPTINLGDKPQAVFSGHQASTFYIKTALSPDDRFLISGSGDSNVYIWDVDNPDEDPWTLKGHCGEVTSVAWCQSDIGKIASCSDDNTFRIWRSKSVRKTDNKDQPLLGSCQKVVREGSTNDSTAFRRCRHCEKKKHKFASNPKVAFFSGRCKECKLERLKASAKETTESENAKTGGSPPRVNFTTTETTPRAIKTPVTPRDSKSLMETWLKSPTVSKFGQRSVTSEHSEVPVIASPSCRTPTRDLPVSERHGFENTKESKGSPRSILIALKSPRDSDLMKSRKRQRTSTSSKKLRYAAKRKREEDKENTPLKIQKLFTSFTSNRSDGLSPKNGNLSSNSSSRKSSITASPSSFNGDVCEISDEEDADSTSSTK